MSQVNHSFSDGSELVSTARGFVSTSRLAYRGFPVGELRVVPANTPFAPRRRTRVVALPWRDVPPGEIRKALSDPPSAGLSVYELMPPPTTIPTVLVDCLVLVAGGVLAWSLVVGLALPTVLEMKGFGGDHQSLSARQYMRLQSFMADTRVRTEKPEVSPSMEKFESALGRGR
jgi:hypothetical protein